MSTPRQTTRRRFLQNMAAAGAAGIVLPSTRRALGSESPNDRPVFATIGLRKPRLGHHQQDVQVRRFRGPGRRRLEGARGPTSKTREKKARQEAGLLTKTIRRVLDRKDVAAVMVATPDHWHTKIVVEAMHAGKDVYCEKPLTLTIDEGKIIEKAVKETGRVFQVGTMQRTECGHRFLQAVAMVQDGRIGTVKR